MQFAVAIRGALIESISRRRDDGVNHREMTGALIESISRRRAHTPKRIAACSVESGRDDHEFGRVLARNGHDETIEGGEVLGIGIAFTALPSDVD